jgi:hypothetical protein
MADILPREILFNDGEGLTHGDLNSMQRHLHATIFDGIMAGWAIQDDIDATGPSIDNMYCLGNGGAPYAADTGLTIKNLRGMVLQRTAATVPIGTDPQFLSYYLEDDEYSSTLPAVTTDPRWDIVCIKLEQESADAADQELRDFEDALTRELTTSNVIKKRKVKATIQVVPGTEDVSPVEPATPSGFVKIAAFQVRFGETEFDPKQDIRDYRVPVGFREDHIVPKNFSFIPDNWDVGESGMISSDGAGARQAFAICPVSGGTTRIMHVGYGIKFIGPGVPSVFMARMDHNSSTAGTDVTRLITFFNIAGWNVQTPEFPIWTNGYMAGYAVDRTQFSGEDAAAISAGPESACIEVLSDSASVQTVTGARFYLCG